MLHFTNFNVLQGLKFPVSIPFLRSLTGLHGDNFTTLESFLRWYYTQEKDYDIDIHLKVIPTYDLKTGKPCAWAVLGIVRKFYSKESDQRVSYNTTTIRRLQGVS